MSISMSMHMHVSMYTRDPTLTLTLSRQERLPGETAGNGIRHHGRGHRRCGWCRVRRGCWCRPGFDGRAAIRNVRTARECKLLSGRCGEGMDIGAWPPSAQTQMSHGYSHVSYMYMYHASSPLHNPAFLWRAGPLWLLLECASNASACSRRRREEQCHQTPLAAEQRIIGGIQFSGNDPRQAHE
jgi:hypothetical protein